MVRPRPGYAVLVFLAVIAGGEIAGFAGAVFAFLLQFGEDPATRESSVPATEEVGSLGAVAHPKQLVGGTQMLLYG